MIIIGLTGSIGMGKSTVAAMMENLGVPVHDSDLAVHALYEPGAAGYNAVLQVFPAEKFPALYEMPDMRINRAILGGMAFADENIRLCLEGIFHPLAQESQRHFIRTQKTSGMKMVALDIPLLFETGAQSRVDCTLVVTAPPHVQRQRVLSRPGMTEEKFQAILKRQMPDGEKCARADYILQTGLSRADTIKTLKSILQEIQNNHVPKNHA